MAEKINPGIDTAPCVYFSCTDDGIVLSVNQMLCETLRFSRDELIDHHVERLFPVSSKIFYQTHVFPLLKMQGKVEELFMFLQTSTGEQIPTLLNGNRTLVNENINQFVGIRVENRQRFEQDLIEKKVKAEKMLLENELLTASQQELRSRTRELDEALFRLKSNHDELTQLNKVVTHDLQEPVRKLLYVMDLLKNQQQGEQRAAELLDRLSRATRQLTSVVKAMQEYLWIIEQPVSWGVVDLNNLIKEQVQLLEARYDLSNVRFDIRVLPECPGDEAMLKTVFYHLLDNTVRYSKAGETNLISVRGVIVKRNAFRHTEDHYEYAKYLKVDITDTGSGFPADDLINIFRLFKRMHQEDGLGMGLAVSRRIIEKHNGFITVDSSEGKGTSIELFLPVHKHVDTSKNHTVH